MSGSILLSFLFVRLVCYSLAFLLCLLGCHVLRGAGFDLILVTMSLDIRRALLNENPMKPVAGSFAGIGVGVGAGLGWGPGFGHANVGYIGAGSGAGVLIGYVLCGVGIGFGVPHEDCRVPILSDAVRALSRASSARSTGVSDVQPPKDAAGIPSSASTSNQ